MSYGKLVTKCIRGRRIRNKTLLCLPSDTRPTVIFNHIRNQIFQKAIKRDRDIGDLSTSLNIKTKTIVYLKLKITKIEVISLFLYLCVNVYPLAFY